MVGIPKTSAIALFQSPKFKQRLARTATRTLQPPIGRQTIDSAIGADASVTQQNLFAKIGRLRTQLPLMYTKVRTECESPGWNFKRTPAAYSAAVRAFGNMLSIDPSTGHCARSAHTSLLQCHEHFAYCVADYPFEFLKGSQRALILQFGKNGIGSRQSSKPYGQKTPLTRQTSVCTFMRVQLCEPTVTRFRLKRSRFCRWLVMLP